MAERAMTKEEILSKMERRYRTKMITLKDITKGNYDAAKTHMKTEYGKLPFNTRIKSAYNAAIDAAVYDPKDWWVAKQKANYERKMF
jgi:hypothetical protein